MPRPKIKSNNGSLEGLSHTFKPRPSRKGKIKRSPFSLEPSLLTSNLEKSCIRCPSPIESNEEHWYYPKLSGHVHKSCSRKVVK